LETKRIGLAEKKTGNKMKVEEGISETEAFDPITL
jgi:hypothetical protein